MNEIIIRRSHPNGTTGADIPNYPKTISKPKPRLRPEELPELPPISDGPEIGGRVISHRDRGILNKKLKLIRDLKMGMENEVQTTAASDTPGTTRKEKLAYIDKLTDEYVALYNKKYGVIKPVY